jgi:hypothetical protein
MACILSCARSRRRLSSPKREVIMQKRLGQERGIWGLSFHRIGRAAARVAWGSDRKSEEFEMTHMEITPYQPLPGTDRVVLAQCYYYPDEIPGSGLITIDRDRIARKENSSVTFPFFIKLLVFGSVVPLILSISSSMLYFIWPNLFLMPTLALLFISMSMFAVGMSAAKYYDGRGR